MKTHHTYSYKHILGRHLTVALLAAACTLPATAQQTLQSGARITDARIDRVRDSIVVRLTLDIDSVDVGSSQAVVLMPCLTTRQGETTLPAIEVMGRKREVYARRNGDHRYAGSPAVATTRRKTDNPLLHYRTSVPYRPGTDQAQLLVREDLCGCGDREQLAQSPTLAQGNMAFVPSLAYVRPQAVAVKAQSLSGQAYLDFPVNRTEIHPDYRRNPAELAKIRATIDTVRSNPTDYRITRITLKGFASPEGTYALNTRLSQGRTRAVKRYVTDRYGYPDSLFRLDNEPENWEGLRRYVEQTGLEDKAEILALIDRTDLQPDAKERELRTRHPRSYRLLLDECYPGLRRTDYRVDYVVRGFNTDEAKALIHTRPQDLSLEEMFLVAQEYEPGSPEFKQVFDVAVRMYPHDPVANLNAANALLENGQADQALRLLQNADACAETDNARAVALLLQGRYDDALPLLQRAAQAGLPEAKENMKIYGNED